MLEGWKKKEGSDLTRPLGRSHLMMFPEAP